MKVLISVDASDHAEKAFDWYVKNFHKAGDEVVVFHGTDPPRLPTLSLTGTFPVEEITKLMTENNKKVAALENNYTMKCGQMKMKNKIAIVPVSGSPGETIIETAKKENVELIVMGSRGLGTVRRTFIGSVSDYVLHHSKIPVLICPK